MLKTFLHFLCFFVFFSGHASAIEMKRPQKNFVKSFSDTADDIRRDDIRRQQRQDDIRRDETKRDSDQERIRRDEEKSQERRLNPE